MSDADHAHEAVERLDFYDEKSERPGFDRRAFLRRTALTGAAAASVGGLLSACGSSASSSSSSSAAIFGSHPEYKFTFVNHVTTNPFFVPTQYGIQDACKLFGCSYSWTGSETSNVSQMVNAVGSISDTAMPLTFAETALLTALTIWLTLLVSEPVHA